MYYEAVGTIDWDKVLFGLDAMQTRADADKFNAAHAEPAARGLRQSVLDFVFRLRSWPREMFSERSIPSEGWLFERIRFARLTKTKAKKWCWYADTVEKYGK
jgi:hypothetical protein